MSSESLKPKTPVEAVANQPSEIRVAAIDLALLRCPRALSVIEMEAVRRHMHAVAGAGERGKAERGFNVGGLTASQINDLWTAAESVIKRAEGILRLRGARAWSYELSKEQDMGWPILEHVDIIYHALQHGDHAHGHVIAELNKPSSRRISRIHRGRIEKGAKLYERYLEIAKKTHSDPHDVEHLLEEWQHMPYVNAAILTDPRPADYNDYVGRQRAQDLFVGFEELEKMMKNKPEIQSRFEALTPDEKITYISYLGLNEQNRFVARSRMPFVGDYGRMAPILAKIEGSEPYPPLRTLRERAADIKRKRTPTAPEISDTGPKSIASDSRPALPPPEDGGSGSTNTELAELRRRLGIDK